MRSGLRRLIGWRPRGFGSRVLVVLVGFLVAGATAALAYFLVTVLYAPNSFALAKATSLSAPTAATATEASSTSVSIGWTPPVSQLPGAQYEVIRNPGPGQVIVCTVLTSPCTDGSLISGTTYNYSVVAVLGDSWESSAATTSFTTLGVMTSSLPDGTVGVPYSATLEAMGGSGTYTAWRLSAGTLPSWATLNPSTGKITGTPTAAITTLGLTFAVTDSNNFTASSGPMSLTVDKATTMTALSLSDSSVAYGDESGIIFTATVMPQDLGSPTGTITVSNGNTTLCTITLPNTACSIVNTNAGNVTLPVSNTGYVIAASYSGDGNFKGSTSTNQTLFVTPGQSSTVLALDPESVTYGSENAETFTATVTGAPDGVTPTGTVKVEYGSAVLCTTGNLAGSGDSASATCPLAAVKLDAGTFGLTASYSGDANYLSSTSPTQDLMVDKATPTVSLSVGTSHITYGDEGVESFMVSVTGPTGGSTPTGTVSVYQGLTLLCTTPTLGGSNNQATSSCNLAATTLSAGSFSNLTAVYNPNGDPNYLTASSGFKSLTVDQDSTKTAVSESPTSVSYGDESASVFTVSITTGHDEELPGPGSESVTVTVGTTSCAASVSPSGNGGTGTCSLPITDAGNTALGYAATPYAVSASYTGDTDLSSSSGSATTGLSVTKAALTITASSATMTEGGTPPTITASYSGFVAGQTSTNLTALPTCSTTATSGSKPGPYPSSCSGAVDPNYAISYVNGTVTVVAPPPPSPARLTLANGPGNTPGQMSSGDTISVVYSEAIDPSSFCASWTGSGPTYSLSGVTVQLFEFGPTATISLNQIFTPGICGFGQAFNFGYISLGVSPYYPSGGGLAEFTDSTITYDASTDTLVITLGSQFGDTPTVTQPFIATYFPDPAIQNTSGEGITGTAETNDVEEF
jgi:large repetitive protein